MTFVLKYLRQVFGIYLLLFVFLVPFAHQIGDFQRKITHFLFGDAIRWISHSIFEKNSRPDFSSDSYSLGFLLLLLLFFSILLAGIIQNKGQKAAIFIGWIEEIIRFYLILVLFVYGLDKVLLMQFPVPAANIAYSNFGQLDRDILYWSVIGLSSKYQFILGITEIIGGLLLAFNRTKVVGLLLSLAIFIQVLIINIGFDISVKIFSIHLIIMVLFLLRNQLKTLFEFFVLGRSTKLVVNSQLPIFRNSIYQFSILIIVALLSSGSYWFREENRPDLQNKIGAYEVIEDSTIGNNQEFKRVFIHPEGFLIFQNSKEKMIDFYLHPTKNATEFEMEDYQKQRKLIRWKQTRSENFYELEIPSEARIIKLKKSPWKTLPAFQDDFHWFVESVN